MPKLAIDIEARLASFQDGLNQLNRSAAGVAGKLESAFKGVTGALAGLGVGLSAAGLTGLVKSAIDAADNLGKLSQKVGVSVESLSKLNFAAKLSDVSTEQLGDGLRKLAVNMQAAGRGAGESLGAFKALGIAQKELLNLSPEEAFNRIAEAFSEIEDGAGKTALAVQIFGRSGADLIPLLNAGAKGLKEFGDEAERLGLVMGSSTAQAAEQFNDNMTRITSSAQALGISLANSALPALNKFTEQVIVSQRIFGSLGSAFLNIGVKVDPFKTLGENIANTTKEVERLQKVLGGIPASGARLRASIAGELDIAKKQLEFLKFQQLQEGQALIGPGNADARDRALAAGSTGGKKRKAPGVVDAAAAAREATKAEQELIAKVKERTALDVAAYQDQIKVIEARYKVEEDAQTRIDAAQKAAKTKSDSDLSSVLGRTDSGKLAEVERLLLRVNEALVAGEINTKQYNEAFKVLEEQQNEILGRAVTPAQKLSEDWKQALEDMKFAVERWGRQFTETLVDVVMTGKLNFRSLAQSIIADLLRMTIQASITAPLFKAIQSYSLFAANGLAFGPGGNVMPFASGGVVTSPTLFKFAGGTGLMGEAGAEAIMPLKRGADGKLGVAASGGGGLVINNFIDARADRSLIQNDIRRGVEQGLAAQADSRRRGGGG